MEAVDDCVKTIYSHTQFATQAAHSSTHTSQRPTGTIVKAANLRAHSIRPASGRALVCVALCDGLGMLLPQWLDQCPNPVQALQANLWDCAYEDQVIPGGGSA
jgi:hypothetical protein